MEPTVARADEALTRGSPAVTRWERGWELSERWLALALLLVSATGAAVNPRSRDAWLGTLVLTVVAAAWVTVGHRVLVGSPARSRVERDVASGRGESRGRLGRGSPAVVALHLAVVLLLAAALVARDVAFFVFAIAGFFYAGALRPYPLVFVGTATTSFLILFSTWDGIPDDAGGVFAFVAVLVLQTGLIAGGVVGGEKLGEVNEERRRTVATLEATLAENEGLHAQLVVQAREAGVRDERQRLAREIHDTLAQGLTGVITQLEAAQHRTGDPEVSARHVANAASLARTSLTEARRSVQALAPGALVHGRLEDALDDLVRGWSDLHGIPATADVDPGVGPHPAVVEVALLRVAQEGLANVAKHAGAGRVGVTLTTFDDRVVLDVRDDGRGFDPGAVDGTTSFGLATMRDRLAGVGGTLEVETAPGRGTAISAVVPLPVTTAGEHETRVRDGEEVDGAHRS